MYVSTINILWSVVYITGYKEKETAELTTQKHYTDMHLLNIYRNWLTTAIGSCAWRRVTRYLAGGVAKFPHNWYAVYIIYVSLVTWNDMTRSIRTSSCITVSFSIAHICNWSIHETIFYVILFSSFAMPQLKIKCLLPLEIYALVFPKKNYAFASLQMYQQIVSWLWCIMGWLLVDIYMKDGNGLFIL
jgi:hypothetical protein